MGKSALCLRYVQDTFVDTYDPTIEANYRVVVHDGKINCAMEILDTAGQEDFSVLREQQMRVGEGFLMVYAVTLPQSFAQLTTFHKQVLQYAGSKCPLVVAGNKCDCESQRTVTYAEGEELAKSFNAPFFETSAKNNVNVSDCFVTLAGAILKVKESKPKEAKKKKGCTIL